MSKKEKIILKIAVFAIVAIALIFQVMMIFQSQPDPDSPILGGYLTLAYITLGIAVLVALLFPVIHMISNPKRAVKGLLGVAVIVVLGLISYLFASNEFTAIQLEKLHITEGTSVLVGAGLNLTLIVGIVTALAAVFLAVRGSISK